MGGCLLLLLVTLITPMLAQEYQCDPTPNGLSDNCIGCICEASTRCNATTKCISGGSFCGPFLLSKPFWVDGGSCVLEGDSLGDQGAWRRCALDIICSANTIRSYINRFGKVFPLNKIKIQIPIQIKIQLKIHMLTQSAPTSTDLERSFH